MTSTTTSVIIAAAQSVGKVFVIGTVGYLSVICEFFSFWIGVSSNEYLKKTNRYFAFSNNSDI